MQASQEELQRVQVVTETDVERAQSKTLQARAKLDDTEYRLSNTVQRERQLTQERKSVSLLFSGGNRRRLSDLDGESESTNSPSGPSSSGRDPIEGSRPVFLAFINRFRYTGIIHLPPWEFP